MASGSNAPFSGDHNDLDNVQDGQHHAAATPDGSTIIRDSNGDLAAQVSNATIIGDFEASFGSWSKSAGGNIHRESGGAQSTSKRISLIASGADKGAIERSFDFTEQSELIFFKKVHATNDVGNEFKVKIGNKTVFSDRVEDNSFKKVSADVSNISGSKNIKMEVSTGGGSFDTMEVYIDRIKVLTPGAKSGTTVNGAGN